MAAEAAHQIWILKRLSLADLVEIAVARGLTLVRRSADDVVLRAKDGVEMLGVEHRRSGLRYMAVPNERRQWDSTLLMLLAEFGHNRISLLVQAQYPLIRDEQKLALALPLAVSFPVEDARALHAFRLLYQQGSGPVRDAVVKALDQSGWSYVERLIAELAQIPPSDQTNPFEVELRALGCVELPAEALATVVAKLDLGDLEFEPRSVWQARKHVVVLGVHEHCRHMAAVAPGNALAKVKWRQADFDYAVEDLRRLCQ